MHITLVITSLYPGGAERVLSQLANYWDGKGHQVTLVTLSPPAAVPFYPLNPSISLIQLDQLRSDISLPVRIKNILERLYCLRKTLKKLQPDVIVSFMDIMNITVLIATLNLKIPTIISERIDPRFHKLPKLLCWLRLKLYPQSSKLIVQTESAAQYFPTRFKKIINVIPNPVNEPKFKKEGKLNKVMHIITTGRLEKQKDQITLIYAFANLLKHHSNLHLIIYGEGKERQNLESLVVLLNIEANVNMPGTIKDIQHTLMRADLFIFPSLYEGFPNALCEAMAIGLPVIASDCSGNKDIIRDGIDGLLFPAGNVEALTTIALNLLDDPERREYLAQNAKDLPRRFDSASIFSQWDKVLYQAATESRL